ncbi:MAG: cytochrome o ubiquinol oxidase subunit III [Candidatus Saccharibacteria bacterium]|nr:MAG: cytochrome o ubiquinol oxidase subunit III [Candidatus Saccharibacteria bacterium]
MSKNMKISEAVAESQAQQEIKSLGFWIYLMTDCILFASLFATYIVLQRGTFGGPGSHELFDLQFVLVETLLLLTSSFVCGLTMLAVRVGRKSHVIGGLIATFLLGAAFLGMELSEFATLAAEGHGWWSSAFLSAFFTLVGTHGLHIAIGLLWIGVLVWQIKRRGLTDGVVRRLGLFGLFWHFLDVIWIFIFTIVYLMGVL